MLKELRERLKLRARLTEMQLRLSEALMPKGYYAQMRPVYARPEWQKDRKTYDRLHDWPHLRDGNRVLQAHLILDMVRDLPEGDYAELGTYRGNYARIIYARMAAGANLVCFDTFEGFDDRDVKAEVGVDPRSGLFADTSLRRVERNITDGAPGERLTLVKGFFPETFRGYEDRRFRFALLDADLYAPIKAGLETFWPRLVPGGVVLVHDYLSDYFTGVKTAVEEFCAPLGLVPVPWPDRVGSAVLFKPKTPGGAAPAP